MDIIYIQTDRLGWSQILTLTITYLFVRKLKTFMILCYYQNEVGLVIWAC